jgi:hypothetical protein
MYPSGFYLLNPRFDIKTTKNKPSKTTIAIFQALQHNSLIKKEIVEIICSVNEVNYYSGRNASTIAWHTNTGRLNRVHKNGRSTFSITPLGIAYAKERNIF